MVLKRIGTNGKYYPQVDYIIKDDTYFRNKFNENVFFDLNGQPDHIYGIRVDVDFVKEPLAGNEVFEVRVVLLWNKSNHTKEDSVVTLERSENPGDCDKCIDTLMSETKAELDVLSISHKLANVNASLLKLADEASFYTNIIGDALLKQKYKDLGEVNAVFNA